MSIGDNTAVLEIDEAFDKSDAKFAGFILNCVPSQDTEEDWLVADGDADAPVDFGQPLPSAVDLRASWWTIRSQGKTGACVGFATADSVLRWHYVQRGLIGKNQFPSPRFIWMANKETDSLTRYPSSFLEVAGSATRDALNVARKFGCVLEPALPMTGGYPLSRASIREFYTGAAPLRIHSFRNLFAGQADRISVLKRWIAQRGPVLTRLTVDRTWRKATSAKGKLATYRPYDGAGGHAVALVGYTPNYFIVRNSYGRSWGDKGFAYASYNYTQAAFTEAYGVVI
ncbi:MAG: C1 family peptidase [Erythrobacter sp.]